MEKPILEFGLTRENEERRDGGCAVIFDPATGLYAVGERSTDGGYILFSGGMQEGEDVETAVLREAREESGLYDFAQVEKIAEAMVHYRNSLKQVNRVGHATCFLVILRSSDLQPTALEEHEKFHLVWKTRAQVLANWAADTTGHGLDHWIYFLNAAGERAVELGFAKAA